MPGSRSSNDPDHKSPRESGEDSEDESEILEESPCGRWLKRREEFTAGHFKNEVQRGAIPSTATSKNCLIRRIVIYKMYYCFEQRLRKYFIIVVGNWPRLNSFCGGPNGGKQFFQRGGLHLRLNTRSYQNTANGMEPDLQFLWRLIPNLWLNIITVRFFISNLQYKFILPIFLSHNRLDVSSGGLVSPILLFVHIDYFI
ncbi:Nuclear receptor-binding protein like protein [Gryllus bimaculatus]|nr:Nuclear receptor-binding protein like protein [Gryllus bimaculatus]